MKLLAVTLVALDAFALMWLVYRIRISAWFASPEPVALDRLLDRVWGRQPHGGIPLHRR
jgi:hypothetical protein